jgi:Do/DeqQ family serine protease
MPDNIAPAGHVESYADVVDRVAPAVVTIRASRRVRAPQQFPFSDDPFFRRFFGNRMPQGGGGSAMERALGSGVIVRPDGYILTNHHVVDGAEEIKVDLANHETYSAKLIGSDAPSDLALLRIQSGNLPVLHLGDSDRSRVGDIVLAVGNPLGIGETVTSGIISAKGRATGLSDGSFQDFIQTDAPINQGNSGGALVNTRAELIGINSQILSPGGGGNIGIGFAIPSNMAKSVMDQLASGGKVRRGMLGVGIQPVTTDLAPGLGLKQAKGVLVNSVVPGGPAEKAGLKTGDVILAVNGQGVDDTNLLRNRIAGMSPGTDLTLTVSRDGKEQQMHARIGELTDEAGRQRGDGGGSGEGGRLGLALSPLTGDVASELGLARGTQGVVVDSVEPDSPAANAGIQPGDVIQQVNRQTVRTADDVRSQVQKSGDRPPLLLINRKGQTLFLAVPVK